MISYVIISGMWAKIIKFNKDVIEENQNNHGNCFI